MSKPVAVAVYARISSDQDGTALGVSRQLEDCRKLAEREGWTVAEEYVDNDISAFSGKRRPGYERLLVDLRDGLRDAVIVYHQDRLTRRPIELEQFLEIVTAAGVQHVRFVAGANVDMYDGDGLMVLRVLGAVAASESATKSRRAKRKSQEVAAAGKPHGGLRPFGYEVDKITIRRDEADMIRALTDRFLAGESLRSLATWLESEGVPTVKNSTWQTSTVRGVLAAPRIAGLREHCGVVVGPAVWDPIISVEQHQNVVARLEQNVKTGRRTPRSYLLSGMLRCGKCDGKLYSSRRATTRRYVCMSGPDHGGCGKLTIVAEPVEELVTAAVLYRLDTPELGDVIAGRAAQNEQGAALSEALAAEQAQLLELAEMWSAKQLGRSEWMTARGPIEARVNDLERRLARLTRDDVLATVVGNGEALRGQWGELNLTRQNAIVRAVLDRAVIAPAVRRGGVFDPDRVDPVWRV